jgi:hypothetical protein
LLKPSETTDIPLSADTSPQFILCCETAPRKIGLLQADIINELQQASIEKLVTLCAGAHMIDVVVRYEGEDRRFQADWIKHLEKRNV